jgi:hypothetical protein
MKVMFNHFISTKTLFHVVFCQNFSSYLFNVKRLGVQLDPTDYIDPASSIINFRYTGERSRKLGKSNHMVGNANLYAYIFCVFCLSYERFGLFHTDHIFVDLVMQS